MKKKIKQNKVFTLKELITTIIVPLLVALITVFVAGHFQMLTISESSDAQIEAAIKTANAQIKAAEISKVTEIEYDYKETNNWNVKDSIEYMPLKKGNYWIYKGFYTSYSINLKKYYTKDVNVKFAIKEEIQNNGISLFIVNNFPQEIYPHIKDKFDVMDEEELNSSEPIEFDDGDNVSGLLLVANKLFYIPYEELDTVEKYINAPNKLVNEQLVNPYPSLSYENLIFEFPMFKGQRFGDLNSITRGDLSHFWYVNEVREIATLNGDTYEKTQIFDLIYNTLPDQQTIVFRPYLGILSLSNKHNGTPEDLLLDLEEFKFQ